MSFAMTSKTCSFVGSVPTHQRQARPAAASRLVVRAGPYDEELVKTAVSPCLTFSLQPFFEDEISQPTLVKAYLG